MEQCSHIVIQRVHVLHKPFISFVVNLRKHSEKVDGKMLYMKEELNNLVTKHIIHKLWLQYKDIKIVAWHSVLLFHSGFMIGFVV